MYNNRKTGSSNGDEYQQLSFRFGGKKHGTDDWFIRKSHPCLHSLWLLMSASQRGDAKFTILIKKKLKID